MKIQNQLMVNLWKYAPSGEAGTFQLDCNFGDTAGSVVEFLNIPFNVQKMALVNDRHADEETNFSDRDALILYPAMARGIWE